MEAISEFQRCLESPWYFYNKYWKVLDAEGNEIQKKELTEEDFNKIFERYDKEKIDDGIQTRVKY